MVVTKGYYRLPWVTIGYYGLLYMNPIMRREGDLKAETTLTTKEPKRKTTRNSEKL